MSLRIAHFSDIHLTAKSLRLRKRDWLGKRSTGWFNAKMGRGRHFVDASSIASVMVRDIKAQAFDHVIFSGDATTLGLSSEFEEVRRVLTPDEGWPSRIAVPGNHDYYTPSAARGGEFGKNKGDILLFRFKEKRRTSQTYCALLTPKLGARREGQASIQLGQEKTAMFELRQPDTGVPSTDRRACGFFRTSRDCSWGPLGPSSLVVAVLVSPYW